MRILPRFLVILFMIAAISLPVAAQDGPLDPVNLLAGGWAETSTGLWTRTTIEGTVQTLAFEEGRTAVVPKLQAELERLTAQVVSDPRPELFEAMDQLVGTLAQIHDRPEATLATKKAAPPPCYPNNLSTYVFTWALAPPGGLGIIANAYSSWDGGNYWCPGHAYTRASYDYYVGSSNYYDLDYCATSDNYGAICHSYLFMPNAGGSTFTSCSAEAFAYLTVWQGAIVIIEEQESNSCF